MATNVALQAYKSGVRAASGGKRKTHSAGGRAIPVLPVIGMAVPVLEAWNGYKAQPQEGMRAFLGTLAVVTTGYSITDRKFHFEELRRGALPIVVGVLGHKVANYIGVNRLLAKYKMPFRL